jgi:hypothetical protein
VGGSARRLRGGAVALALAVTVAGCGADAKSGQPVNGPTVSLWLNVTASEYRQVAGGAKLALAERGGHAGVFRINYSGQQVSDDPSRTTLDAVGNARAALEDPQASAVLTNVSGAAADAAITLLNEAGVPVVALGDAALKRTLCSASSNVYPNGSATAIVVGAASPASSAAWRARFRARLGFEPSDAAWHAYQGVEAVLASLGTAGVTVPGSDPARLNRDALAAELVRTHGDCA